MNNTIRLATASVLALALASPAAAQGTLIGTEAFDDRIRDIERDVAEDLAEAEDAARFGRPQYDQGLSGSVALGFSATDGNTDNVDLSAAGRLRYGAGLINHSLGFGIEISEGDGTRTEEEVFATYDVNRYLSDRFYVFGLGSIRYDRFDSNRWDAFLGVGPGYRVISEQNVTWRVQAGPGIRYLRDQEGDSTTELGAVAASYLFYEFGPTMYLTNDTELLWSDDNTSVYNDLGVNFRMTDAWATRVSYRTEWNSDPLPGLRSTDNTLGVSLVYGF
jgi:putative salt-induced outer membrane protein